MVLANTRHEIYYSRDIPEMVGSSSGRYSISSIAFSERVISDVGAEDVSFLFDCLCCASDLNEAVLVLI